MRPILACRQFKQLSIWLVKRVIYREFIAQSCHFVKQSEEASFASSDIRTVLLRKLTIFESLWKVMLNFFTSHIGLPVHQLRACVVTIIMWLCLYVLLQLRWGTMLWQWVFTIEIYSRLEFDTSQKQISRCHSSTLCTTGLEECSEPIVSVRNVHHTRTTHIHCTYCEAV